MLEMHVYMRKLVHTGRFCEISYSEVVSCAVVGGYLYI